MPILDGRWTCSAVSTMSSGADSRQDVTVDRRGSVTPELVLASQSEAAEYLIAESLLVLTISAALVGLFVRSPWALIVMFAFGLPAQLLRTRLANRIKARMPVGRRSQGWWQFQLDRPAVVRRAVGLVLAGK